MLYSSSVFEEESVRKDVLFVDSVSQNISDQRRVGSGIFRKLAVGRMAHEEGLFEGLFEKLLFDIE